MDRIVFVNEHQVVKEDSFKVENVLVAKNDLMVNVFAIYDLTFNDYLFLLDVDLLYWELYGYTGLVVVSYHHLADVVRFVIRIIIHIL